MLTKDAVAAEAPPPAAGLDEATVPGELDDPEDPQPASGTASVPSVTAGGGTILCRACLIGSLRPTNTPPFPPPALFAAIVAVPEPVWMGFTGPNHDHG